MPIHNPPPFLRPALVPPELHHEGLRAGFDNQWIGAGGLLPGALLPTTVAATALLLL